MKRREFVTLLGGASVWPLAARAQQREPVRRIGVLLPATADDQVWQTRLAAFHQGLALLGWTIGRNVHIDTHWGTPNAAELRKHAAEIAALAPDIISATPLVSCQWNSAWPENGWSCSSKSHQA